MTPAETLAVASRLTRAISAADVDELARLYVPNAVIWHSFDQVEMALSDVLNLVKAIGSVSACNVEVTNTLPTEIGFVQTQRNTYSLRDGRTTFFYAALVVTLNDEGRILRLDEYLDRAGLAPLVAALSS
jgi:ketosteroid isomerase-like protein